MSIDYHPDGQRPDKIPLLCRLGLHEDGYDGGIIYLWCRRCRRIKRIPGLSRVLGERKHS